MTVLWSLAAFFFLTQVSIVSLSHAQPTKNSGASCSVEYCWQDEIALIQQHIVLDRANQRSSSKLLQQTQKSYRHRTANSSRQSVPARYEATSLSQRPIVQERESAAYTLQEQVAYSRVVGPWNTTSIERVNMMQDHSAQAPTWGVMIPDDLVPMLRDIWMHEPLVAQSECLAYNVDYSKPISQVLDEHPGVDGWCLFGGAGTWVTTCARARLAQDYRFLVVQYGSDTVMGQPDHEPAEFRYPNFVGDFEYLALDDSYCLENGWLDTPFLNNLDVYNATRMTELSDQECSILRQEFPDLDQLAFPFFLAEGNYIGNHTSMRLHAAWKCALGGLQCDIANCMFTYCKQDNNFIGHARQCRENWMPEADIQYYWTRYR